MLNFRKLRQDFSSNTLKEGRSIFEKHKILNAKIIKLDNETIRFSSKVLSNYESTYESEIEVDRLGWMRFKRTVTVRVVMTVSIWRRLPIFWRKKLIVF